VTDALEWLRDAALFAGFACFFGFALVLGAMDIVSMWRASRARKGRR
jgi:hypothetical protein